MRRLIHFIVRGLLSAPYFKGRDFLIEKLPQLLPKPPEHLILKTEYGFKMHIFPLQDINIDNALYNCGVYELGTIKIIRNFVKPGNTVVDVGANIGFISMYASVRTGSMGRVHSFEPVDTTRKLLIDNIELNNFENICVYPYALGDTSGVGKVVSFENSRGGSKVVPEQRSDDSEVVEIKPLDAIIETPVHFIKIDVEGYELQVLKGAEKIIEKWKPILLIEYSPTLTSDDGLCLREFLKNLTGYRIYKQIRGKERGGKLMPVTEDAHFPVHDNVLLLPVG